MTWQLIASGAVLGGVLGIAVAGIAKRLSGGEAGQRLWIVIGLQAALGAWAAAGAEGPLTAAVSLVLSAALLVLALVDLAIFRLPDAVTLPLAVSGLAVEVLPRGDLAGHLAGAVMGWAAIAGLAAAFRGLRKRDGVGMGDAKLFAAAGAWLGWRPLPWTLLLACLLAFAWLGARGLRRGWSSLAWPLPFGAPLALAIWLVRLYGTPFLVERLN